MPLTPFIGLSVFIHLAIIAGYRLFYRFEWTIGRGMKIASQGLRKAIGVSIIVVVFSFVIFQATMLVRASVHDKYSSIKFVSQLVKQARYNKAEKARVAGLEVAATPACYQKFSEAAAPYDDSIVNYLVAKHQDASYGARLQLADAAGISVYEATAAQNTMLLRRELVSDGMLATNGSCR